MSPYEKVSTVISTLTLLCSGIGFLMVIISIGFLYFQTRLQTDAQVVTTLNIIHNRWNSESMLRARYNFCTIWLNGNREFTPVAECIAEFFEEMGVYMKMKAVPIAIMWDAQSWYIEHYYYMFKDGLNEMRDKYKDPTLYTEFEKLFEATVEESKKRRAPSLALGIAELEAFSEGEIRMTFTFLKLKDEETEIGQ